MSPLTLLLAFAEPLPTELVAVSFSPEGTRALVETRWVLDGPGFPVARLEVFDLATGKHLLDERVELREAAAAAGLPGATAAAHEQYSSQLASFGLPAAAATPGTCADGTCGRGAGCFDGGTPVEVATTVVSGETCPENWSGELPTVVVGGKSFAIDAERVPCARHFAAGALYTSGQSGVLILNYEMPGNEGPAPRFFAMAGSFR